MNQKEKFNKDNGIDKVDEGYYNRLIKCLMYLTTNKSRHYFYSKLTLTIHALC